MRRFKVYGSVDVDVVVEVEANDEDGALDAAYDQLNSLSEFIGNGFGKLIGVPADVDAYLTPNTIEYTEAQELE